MKGILIKEWTQVDLASEEGARKFLGAVNYFLRRPEIETRQLRQRSAVSRRGAIVGKVRTRKTNTTIGEGSVFLFRRTANHSCFDHSN